MNYTKLKDIASLNDKDIVEAIAATIAFVGDPETTPSRATGKPVTKQSLKLTSSDDDGKSWLPSGGMHTLGKELSIIDGLRHLGAFGMKIPKEYGGLGFTQREYGEAMKLITSRDGNLVTARTWHDNTPFLREFMKMLNDAAPRRAASAPRAITMVSASRNAMRIRCRCSAPR